MGHSRGSIFLRGNIWWFKYYRNGKLFRESSRSTRKTDAVRLLNKRLGEIESETFKGPKAEKMTLADLTEDFLNDYRINGKKSLSHALKNVKRLKKHFGNISTIDMTTDRINTYIIHRQDEGAANATINRELSAIKRIYNLAARQTPPKVHHVPYIPRLAENNTREGFFTHNEFLALKEALPEYLRTLVTMAYYTGMRKGEVLSLQWEQVDMMEGKITLRGQDTKNKTPRTIYMEAELLEAVRFQRVLRDIKYPRCSWVFFGETGNKIKDFRLAWKKACKEAWENSEGRISLWDSESERSTRIFHDFRRTAVRNMVRAGVPERVAMMISGHKTRSVFERYNIVNEEDLRKASIKVTEYHQDKLKTAIKQDFCSTNNQKQSSLNKQAKEVFH